MTDYTKATGNAGTLLIRDDGYNVSFMLRSSDSQTYNTALPFGWTVNGSSGTGTVNYPSGSPWITCKTFTVTYSQTVTFSIGDTGTWGFEGPDSFSVYLSRATVPSPPKDLYPTNVLPTSFEIGFSGSDSNGGAAIDYYLVRISKNNPPSVSPYTDLVTYYGVGNAFTGLDVATMYYATVYAHNSVGYSAMATVISVMTLGPAHVKVGGVWKYAIPYVKVGGVWKMAQPFVKVGGVWKKTG